jgi:hypothetical protein
MKQGRLKWLVIVMCVLAILRVMVPPSSPAPPVLAQALVRQPAPIATVPALPATAMPFSEPPFSVAAPRERNNREERDVPGNAFAVRPPPLPPYVPPAPRVAMTKVAPTLAPVVVAVSTEPALPPVPFQVIGTWDDGKEPGVFLSSPNGTMLARLGAMLQAEYKVTAITAQQISLVHLASKREVRLAVPTPPNTPRTYP